MIWAMDLDDFTGTHCGQGPWPLLSAIRGALDEGKPNNYFLLLFVL